MSREQLVSTTLAVHPDEKAKTLHWVHESIFPSMLQRPQKVEHDLLVLHRAATWGVEPPHLSPEVRVEQLLKKTEFAEGKSDREMKQLARRVAQGNHGTIRVDLSSPSAKGRYRVLGTITHLEKNQKKTKKIWDFRAIEIITQTVAGDKISTYSTPQDSVDTLMGSLCDSFQSYSQKAYLDRDPVALAVAAAMFYTIGNKFIHPFSDGNHRSFDRILELSFQRIGVPIELPRDTTINIPRESPIRTTTVNCLLNFLRNNSLPLNMPDTHPQYKHYQKTLTSAIQKLITDGLDDPFYRYFYALTAENILSWTGLNYSQEIRGVQDQAQKEGGFEVKRIDSSRPRG